MEEMIIMTPEGRIDNKEPETRTPVVSVRHLHFSYGARLVLKDIDFDLYPGEIFGFLGPNGSGKTTTIKLMLGLLPINSGRITICGKDVGSEFEAALANVGGIVENPEMYGYLTGRQNLELFRRMFDSVEKERIDEVARIVGIAERLGDKVSKYSLGMRQRLGIAQALLADPKVLVLDEPTNGLDPMGIKNLRDLLKKLAAEKGVSVFVSSHQLAELDLMCDRVAVINSGSILRTLTIDEIRNPTEDGKVQVVIDIAPESASLIPEGCPLTLSEGKLTGSLREDEIPATISSLAIAGVQIMGVNQKKRSLEDVFLELTRTTSTVPTVPTMSAVKPAGEYIPTTAPKEEIAEAPSEENKEGGGEQ